MKFTLSIDTANAAFHDEDCPDGRRCDTTHVELARILRDIAARVEFGHGRESGLAIDANGNTVGRFDLEPA